MTRQTAREALAALFVSNGSFTTVNAYKALDLKATNKVLNIYTRSSRFDKQSKHQKNNFHIFNLDVLVLRESGETVEDTLDTLHEAVVSVCNANPQTANWSHLELNEESEATFTEVAGISYRLERHRVTIKITG